MIYTFHHYKFKSISCFNFVIEVVTVVTPAVVRNVLTLIHD